METAGVGLMDLINRKVVAGNSLGGPAGELTNILQQRQIEYLVTWE